MPNTKSAKKQAKQNSVKRIRNAARKSVVKTAIKKVVAAIEAGQNVENTQLLFREAEAQIARAAGKGVLKKNTASRKISRLARQIAAAQ